MSLTIYLSFGFTIGWLLTRIYASIKLKKWFIVFLLVMILLFIGPPMMRLFPVITVWNPSQLLMFMLGFVISMLTFKILLDVSRQIQILLKR